MEDFYILRNQVKSRFQSNSFKADCSQDLFNHVVNIHLQRIDKLDLRPLEVILDLTLTLVDERHQYFNNPNVVLPRQQVTEVPTFDESKLPDHYDADDEGSDESFIFPCHLNCENCHADQLLSYHYDHLKTYYHTSSKAQIIKHTKLVEFVVEQLFQSLRSIAARNEKVSRNNQSDNTNLNQSMIMELAKNLDDHIRSVVGILSKLERVCVSESTNWRILSKTSVLDILLDIIHLLIKKVPDKQDIYLEPLLGFAFRLANFKIIGSQLRQFFAIARESSIQLENFLYNLNKILIYQDDILKNLQPIVSINFPSPSTTASEIYNNSTISSSWHWRMRRKVLEFKKKLIRNMDPQTQKMNDDRAALSSSAASGGIIEQNMTPSWLECSLMLPLSNISQLMQNNYIRFSSSMWISLCGDLFVTLDPGSFKKDGTVSKQWRKSKGQWLRLISNRRLARRRFNDRRRFSRSTASATRTIHHHRHHRNITSPNRDSDEDYERHRFNVQNTTSKLANFNQIRSTVDRSDIKLDKTKKSTKTTRHRQTLNSAPKRVSQELMLHLTSFAVDNLTIEFWLNIKSMLITAKLCRVNSDGQTALLDSTEFCSFLQATGLWSHLVFSIEEKSCSDISSMSTHQQNSIRNTIVIQLIVNATHKVNAKLTYNTNRTAPSNFASLIGCERSTFGYVWKLSQINLYKDLPSDELILYMYGKGPDFWTISNLKQRKPACLTLPDLIKRSAGALTHQSVLELYGQLNEDRCMSWLTQNITSLYVAHKADYFLDYSQTNNQQQHNKTSSSDLENSSNRFIRVEILNFTRTWKFNTNHGFGSALTESGGIESMLVMFADVIRRCPGESRVHSLALSNLFNMSETNQHHLNKFLDELDGLKLIQGLLAHPACIISRSMFDTFFDYCVVKIDRNNCLIKSSKLIFSLLDCWRAWHKDARIAKRLYKKLSNLLIQSQATSESMHPHRIRSLTLQAEHNVRMINEAGGIDILMNILKQCLVPMEDFVPKINQTLVELIVGLMSLLVNHPPTLDIIYDIMEFLLFLHPDHRAYVDSMSDKTSFLQALNDYKSLHDRSYYYNDTINSNYSQNEIVDDGTMTDRNSSFNSLLNGSDYQQHHDLDSHIISSQLKRSISSDIFQSYNEMDQMIEFDKQANKKLSGQTFKIIPGYEMRPRTVMLESLVENDEQKQTEEEEKFKVGLDMNGLGDGEVHNKIQRTKLKEKEHQKQTCSHRSFAVGCIADMLASIIKLTPDSSSLLTEVFSKPIIDPRKLIILANNKSPFVREKVLRLFLYSMKACYSLELRSILNKFEHQDEATKGSKFKICIPIELMGRQLMRYPTTMKMIQLCYSIIVGVDDLEAVESFCFAFGMDTIDNNLKLNVLILLIHTMTQLEDPKEIVSAVIFTHMSAKQILQTGEHQLIELLIRDHLFDSLMKLYFLSVEQGFDRHNLKEDDRPANNLKAQNGVLRRHDNSLTLELDRTMILIVKYYIEELSTVETIRSLQDIMTYFNLMNSHLLPKDQSTLRDRQVKVLSASLRYCKLYETSARETRVSGGRVGYYITSLFNSSLHKFPNILDVHQLEVAAGLVEIDEENQLLTSSSNDKSGEMSDDGSIEQQSSSIASKGISENDLIERFKATVTLAINFIITREQGIIPSPYERQFIEDCIRFLANILEDLDSDPELDPLSHWFKILSKLRRSIQANFSKLILYLLSPCDSMNRDERKYYAQKLLFIFGGQAKLLSLIDDGTLSNHKILLLFLENLIRSDSPMNSEEEDDEANSDFDEELSFGYDTCRVLKTIISELRQELDLNNSTQQQVKSSVNIFGGIQSTHNGFSSNPNNHKPDAKLRDIWLNDLHQLKEESRDRCNSLRLENQISLNGSPVDSLSDKCVIIMDEGLRITHDVVIDKHEQRKAYLEDLKQEKVFNYHVRQQWLSLIIGQTHERSVWFLESHYPKSWELNPVEGPSRIRRRLRPTKLNLNARFLRYNNPERGPKSASQTAANNNVEYLHEQELQNNSLVDDWYYLHSPHPLCALVINPERSVMNATELRARMFTTDKIHINCDCSIIRPNEVLDGEISVASWCMHFIGERKPISNCGSQSRTNSSPFLRDDQRQQHPHDPLNLVLTIVEDLWFDEIVEVMDRRYQLRDVGLEIFLTNNMTYLLSFKNNNEREEFKQCLFKQQPKMINFHQFNQSTNLNRLTQLWRDGRLTNFDFLTCLNKLAGRSFNDLMQYPVFPFVLSNYTRSVLDLTMPENFRNLERPMAIQNPEKEATFLNNYNNFSSANIPLAMGPIAQRAYHYGNHYSNTASVLHFLVRLPPFTQMMIQYQDNNFDQPDRTFHSIASTWQLITQDSNTDFKELIPEFFFLPEMFINFERFDLGRKQNEELVDDVKLPPWCPGGDARLFTLIHRQALESSYVTCNLNHWIDLIFGYKQTGKAAIEALNVFHPATYYGMIDLDQSNGKSGGSSLIDSVLSSNNNNNSNGYRNLQNTNNNTSDEEHDEFEDHNQLPSLNSATSTIRNKADSGLDIERLAMETMIKTYGQMPKQLYNHPMKARFSSNPKVNTKKPKQQRHQLRNQQQQQQQQQQLTRSIEPLAQVIGLKWGSYVGSPDESEIVVIKHKHIVGGTLCAPSSTASVLAKRANSNAYAKIRYNLHLLPNGDIAILNDSSSLLLSYRADRKSGSGYQLSIASSTRYSRQTGLSSVSRMNLFSSMIISRQQFAYLVPPNSLSSEASNNATSSSLFTTLGSTNNKFSLNSLSKISWSHLDGTLRIRHPANDPSKPDSALLQADSTIDSMSCCVSVPELNLLIVGYNSGAACAHIVSTCFETISSSISSQADSNLSNDFPSPLNSRPNSPDLSRAGSSLLADETIAPPSGKSLSSLLLPAKQAAQTVRSINKASRWLYSHTKRINCIRINIGFGIVVTGSADGTCVIWDLNSLSYVRTIGYSLESLHEKRARTDRQTDEHEREWMSDFLCNCKANSAKAETGDRGEQAAGYGAPSGKLCQCCRSGVSLIAMSPTLGDIASVKNYPIRNRLTSVTSSTSANRANGANNNQACSINLSSSFNGERGSVLGSAANSESNGDEDNNRCKYQQQEPCDINNLADDSTGSTATPATNTSVVYVNTINGSLVGLINLHTQVSSIVYSSAPEGVSINVIAVGLSDGVIRLYSSWDLTKVKEFHITGLVLPITSLLYSRDNQLLYCIYEDNELVVLCNKRSKSTVNQTKELLL